MNYKNIVLEQLRVLAGEHKCNLLVWDKQKSNFVDKKEIEITKKIIKKCVDQMEILRYLAFEYDIPEFEIEKYRSIGENQGQINFDKLNKKEEHEFLIYKIGNAAK